MQENLKFLFFFSTIPSQWGLGLNHFDLIPVEKNRNKHFEPNTVYSNRRTDFEQNNINPFEIFFDRSFFDPLETPPSVEG